MDPCKMLKNVCKYVTPCPPSPCRPVAQMHKTDGPFAKETVYKSSFRQQSIARCKPIVPPNQIKWKSAGQFQGDTVQKLSFPVQCAPVVAKILPKDHCLSGAGPMRLMTTQRHDFYNPCGEREKNVQPPRNNLELPGGPMAKLTTNNLSYQPLCASPAKNLKPILSYNPPTDCMDFNTVNRSSFKNVGVSQKIETPWAVKPEYFKPDDEMECCTVYNLSYKYPCEDIVETEEQKRPPNRKAHQFD